MAEEKTLTAETAEPEVKTTEVQETPPTEQPVEEWDKERAAKTIHNLREVEKQAKKDKAELEQLRAAEAKRAEAEMTEAQRLQKQAEAAEAKARKLELDILRRDVIAETGLPTILAARLQGETKEDMLKDAEELKKALPEQKKQAPHLSPSNPGGAATKETDAEMRTRLFGPSVSPYDPEQIRAMGGGVVQHNKE